MRSPALVAVVLLLGVPAAAQDTPPPGGAPSFHGVLEVLPAHGTIDRATGDGALHLRRWRLLLQPAQNGVGSNGIFPDRERVVIAVGAGGENTFYLAPGSLTARRRGKVFAYRAPRGTLRGIKTIRIVAVSTDLAVGAIYRVDANMVGVILSDLLFTTRPACMPFAVIVGDDDGFSGIQLAERNLDGRRISVANSCSPGNDWPWLGQ